MLRVVFKMGNDRYGRDCIKMRVCHQSPAWCLNYIRDNQLFFKTPRCLGCHKDHAQRCGGFVGSSNFPDVGGSFCDHGGLMAYVWLRGGQIIVATTTGQCVRQTTRPQSLSTASA